MDQMTKYKVELDHISAFPYSMPLFDAFGLPVGTVQSHGLSRDALLAGVIAGHLAREGSTVPGVAKLALNIAEEILAEEDRREDAAGRELGIVKD